MIDSGEKQTDNSKIKEAMSFRDVPLFDILFLNPTGLSGVVAKMAMSYKKLWKQLIDQLAKWRGWYNYPVSEADQIAEADAAFRSLAEPSGDMTDGME